MWGGGLGERTFSLNFGEKGEIFKKTNVMQIIFNYV